MKQAWANLTWKAKTGIIAGGIFALIMAMGAFFSEDETSPAADKPAAKTAKKDPAPKKTKKPKAKPKYDGAAYAKKVQAAATEAAGGRTIQDACDYSNLTWHCFFERYESSQPGWIQLQLSFPGGLTDDDIREASKQAREYTFNMAGLTVEDLDTIVSYANGLDTGTSYRRDMFILNK